MPSHMGGLEFDDLDHNRLECPLPQALLLPRLLREHRAKPRNLKCIVPNFNNTSLSIPPSR